MVLREVGCLSVLLYPRGYARFSGGESRANGHENRRFKDLQDREVEEGIEDGINLPSMEIARTFAVETIDHPHPLGNYNVPFLFPSLLFPFLLFSSLLFPLPFPLQFICSSEFDQTSI